MRAVDFLGVNRRFGAPNGWDAEKHGECSVLPVLLWKDGDGLTTMTSVWEFTPEERLAIANGAKIALNCVGGQPPVSLEVTTVETILGVPT